MTSRTHSLVVDAATSGTRVSPLAEQSTILAEEEHVHKSGHQNPVLLLASRPPLFSLSLPWLKIVVLQLRAMASKPSVQCLFIPTHGADGESRPRIVTSQHDII